VKTVLEIEGLRKSFGSVQALAGCTFTAPAKQLTGLLGPNGAGKTTIMRSLVGWSSSTRARSDGAGSRSRSRRGIASATCQKNEACTPP
jgi:ABC-type multidrug transport system ATPase subunit